MKKSNLIKSLLIATPLLFGSFNSDYNTTNNKSLSSSSDYILEKAFGYVPYNSQGPIELVTGDFNRDGNLDLVVASPHIEPGHMNARPTHIYLYYFKGDGKGNFSQ